MLLIAVGVLTSGLDWGINHGLLFTGAGILMLVFRTRAGLPRSWWALAGAFVLLSLAAFLPAGWFGAPEWRSGLEALGLEIGSLQAIQTRQAAEETGVFALTLLFGLWLAGQRSKAPQRLGLAFVGMVAIYAVVAKIVHEPGEAFGFLPNRNHTATLLAMGALVGIGTVTQAVRDKRWVLLGFALAAVVPVMFGLLGWSVSRAGVVLLGVGLIVWFALLGREYVGRHGVKLIGLLVIAAGGLFVLSDVDLKSRLEESGEKLGGWSMPEPVGPGAGGEGSTGSLQDVDFRVPTWMDTLGMIGHAPWTGVGAGQFRYIFPQYRDRTVEADPSRTIHPESDWLWMAAEVGVPATLVLAALVVAAAVFALVRVRRGRVRALRLACLIGALLVGFHGLFDVPGHRVPLAWTAALLFGLALRPASESRRPAPAWVGRAAGVLLLLPGIYLLLAEWQRVPPPALIAVEEAREESKRLYLADQAAMKAAYAAGAEEYDPEVDLLDLAIAELAAASAVVPLDPDLHHTLGMLALQYDDRREAVKAAFARERALRPQSVSVPLRQAVAWGAFGPESVRHLWTEALRRAEENEAEDRAGRWTTRRVSREIRHRGRRVERLRPIIEEMSRSGLLREP
jgi:O-antigen ligase